MKESDAIDEAVKALGLGYITPDQRKVFHKLWWRGELAGWTRGYRAAEFDRSEW